MKCCNCKEEFILSEMVGLNCNNEIVDIEGNALELNAQNPDYYVKIICLDCFEGKTK